MQASMSSCQPSRPHARRPQPWATMLGACLLLGACGSDPVDVCEVDSLLPGVGTLAAPTTAPTSTQPPARAARMASFNEIGVGVADMVPRTTDLWVKGGLALTGSGFVGVCFSNEFCGHFPIVVWDVSDPTAPVVVDTIGTESSLVNDVKISADGRFAVATKEIVRQGILVLGGVDGRIAPLSNYQFRLENGVHNVWIESIAGTDYIFAAEDGTSQGGMHVIDASDLCAPVEVGRYYGGSSSVHDVLVRDGLAFVSHWDAGLVILDVGNGIAGGSPATPVEVSRIDIPGGATHNAWYWPDAGYVFVGQERLFEVGDPPAPGGIVSVVDVSDLTAPAIVATFVRQGDVPPHNFWMDEAQGTLIVGWYAAGLVALDVSGTLSGDLAAQGRELATTQPPGTLGTANYWAPQIERGVIFASDTDLGIRVFELVN